jgi:hypothetical protein
MVNSFEDNDDPSLSVDGMSTAQGRPLTRFEVLTAVLAGIHVFLRCDTLSLGELF